MTRPPASILATAATAALAALLFGGCIVRTPIGGDTCSRGDGRTARVGESFPSPDGCNTCTCGPGGEVACTLIACTDGGLPPPPDGGVTCTRPDGVRVRPGDRFPAPDGCNTCTCGTDGSIACTERACADAGAGCTLPDGRRLRVGESYFDGCNSCSCQADGSLICTARDCSDGGTPPPPPDGGRGCASNRDCASGEICTGPAGCGVAWTCQPDRGCTDDLQPYCSCRGVTVRGSGTCPPEPYAYRGECRTTPPPDGGPTTCRTSADCARGESCFGPEGCGIPWTCQPARGCTADLAPFCSCRGVTVHGSSSCPPEPYAHRGACETPPPPPPDGGPGGCRRTGCSGQICADRDVASTCEWRPEYACYDRATCERQADGACGWTETRELRECLASGGDAGTPPPPPDGGGSFCAAAICPAGFRCCETWRTCLDPRLPVVCPDP